MKSKRSMLLKKKLPFLILSITLVPWLCLALILLPVIYNISLSFYTDKVTETLSLQSGSIARYLNMLEERMLFNTALPEVIELATLSNAGSTADEAYAALKKDLDLHNEHQKQTSSQLVDLYLFNAAGTPISYTNPKSVESFTVRHPHLLPAAAKGTNTVFALLLDQTGTYSVYYAKAVRDSGGKLLGTVVLKNNIDFFIDLFEEYPVGTSSFVFLMDNCGEVLGNQGDIAKNDEFFKDADLRRMMERINEHKENDGSLNYIFHNGNHLAVYHRFENTDWTLVCNLPYSTAFNAVFVTITLITLMIALLGVISFVVGSIYTRGIVGPIHTIIDSLNRFRAGKLDEECHVNTLDEFGELSDSFNEMARSLEMTTSQLFASQLRYKNILDSSSDILWEKAPFSDQVHVSIPPVWHENYADVVESGDYTISMEMFCRENLETLSALEKKVVADPFTRYTAEMHLLFFGNTAIWVLIRAMAVYDEHESLRIYGTIVDINEQKLLGMRFSENEEKYRFVLESMSDVLYEHDIKTDRLILDKSKWEAMFDIPLTSSYTETFAEYQTHINPEHRSYVNDIMSSICEVTEGKYKVSSEYQIRNREGNYIWVQHSIVAINVENGMATRFIGHISDINDRKLYEMDAVYHSQHDSLTGAYNNRSFVSEIQHRLEQLPDKKQAMIVIDIDDFKRFNDTYGHAVGDEVLRFLTNTLWHNSKSMDFVGRTGGDEFVMYVVNYRSRKTLDRICSGVLNDTRAGLNIRGTAVPVTLSMGVALFPEDATTYEELFNKADLAMYHAKRRGKNNYAYYEEGMQK